MEFTPEKFNNIKHEAEEFYNKIESVYSSYFKENINFNGQDIGYVKVGLSLESTYSTVRNVKLILFAIMLGAIKEPNMRLSELENQ